MTAYNSILQLLQSESNAFLDTLYTPLSAKQGSFATQIVFQSLPSLSQQLIIRLLYIQDPVVLGQIHTILPFKRLDELLEELVSLRVLIKANDGYMLNTSFQASLQLSIYQPQEPWQAFSQPDISNARIETHCSEKWQDILYYILTTSTSSSSSHIKKINQIVENYVLQAKLMILKDEFSKERKYTISDVGYNYILKDYVHQVWDYVVYLIQHSTDRKECYDLFFKLSYSQVHVGYKLDNLTTFQQQLVYELSIFGLVYLPSASSKYFYLAHIAQHVLLPHLHHHTSQQAHLTQSLQVIVETNLQVVAYIHSDLQFNMVKLFVDVNIRLPNMVIGRITREKSREAFHAGITAAQIIDFLILHAHPVVKKAKGPFSNSGNASITATIPDNVIDQLILWENETKRIQTSPALIADFRGIASMSTALFQQLQRELEAVGHVLWSHPKDMMLACKPEAESKVQAFMMNHIYRG